VIFREGKLPGTFIIQPERLSDERGFFARTWCRREFENHGLETTFVQFSIAFNEKKHTLRGMHYQAAPHEEMKLIRCTKGAIYDVAIDLQPNSPTYMQWTAVELTEDNREMHYIPRGFAHGYLTLTAAAEVLYQISEFYHPQYLRGVRWNDKAFNVRWPAEPAVMSEKDRQFPNVSVIGF
jgi:dTDP-4-dehydrorhamnose 3,5-epimerase